MLCCIALGVSWSDYFKYICYCSMYIACTCITHIELHPDVELEINRIETNEGRTDQCRVQFIVSVSDARLDETNSTH